MLKALDGRVIVKPKEAEDKIAGAYIIPKEGRAEPNIGEVVAAGEKVTEISVGDTVYYDGNFGTNIEDEGIVYRILEKRNIFAVK